MDVNCFFIICVAFQISFEVGLVDSSQYLLYHCDLLSLCQILALEFQFVNEQAIK